MCGRICVLAVLLGVADFNSDGPISDADRGGGCAVDLRRITVGFLVTLCLTVLLEVAMVVVSMRGSILNVQPRFTMPYIVYTRFRTYTYSTRSFADSTEHSIRDSNRYDRFV